MMNIKRILSILLALVCVGVLVCSLCACDGEGSGEENEGGASSPFYVNYKNVKIELDKKAESVLEQYEAQTENSEDIHFEHYDWTYNDSSCCC